MKFLSQETGQEANVEQGLKTQPLQGRAGRWVSETSPVGMLVTRGAHASSDSQLLFNPSHVEIPAQCRQILWGFAREGGNLDIYENSPDFSMLAIDLKNFQTRGKPNSKHVQARCCLQTSSVWASFQRAWEGRRRGEHEAGWERPCRGDLHTPEHIIHEVGERRGAETHFDQIKTGQNEPNPLFEFF